MKKILTMTGILLTLLACEVPDGTTKSAESGKDPIEENRDEPRSENENETSRAVRASS